MPSIGCPRRKKEDDVATVQMAAEQRFVIEDVSWEAYEALLKSWESRSKRMTYDNGRLEFMMPSLSHEQYGVLIGRMVSDFAVERRIPFHSGRMTTLKREVMRRGLEPDDCFWIQNEPRMRSRKDFDPDSDPPPDLAIEIDITRSSLPRMSIYATLGVPEVWRFDGSRFSIHLLREEGEFEESERSLALPDLTPDVVMRFLNLSDRLGEMELIRTFREWARGEAKGRKKAKRPRKK
jgi:Uma2 family endonuclease